jgi:putative nucleotidyltransferase with HDIG domain
MKADEIIAQVKDLPVVSETARKLAIQLNQPNLHRDELVATLRCDNVLTAKLLRACNSAEFGAREPVVSLDQALLLLGDNMIFRMVCSIGFGGSLGASAPGYDTEANGLWSHSLSTGIGAEYLAEVQSYGNYPQATAFTAGLLHDIGRTVICKILTPKTRTDIRAKIFEESLSRVEAERAVLGADHSEIGACLLKKWSLPEPIIEAVANHHSPVVEPSIHLSAVVYLADCAAHLSNSANTCPGGQAEADQAKMTAAEALRMDVEKVEQFISGIQGALHSLSPLVATA